MESAYEFTGQIGSSKPAGWPGRVERTAPSAYEDAGHSGSLVEPGQPATIDRRLLQIGLDRVAAGASAVEVCRELGIARSWFYELRARYAVYGMDGLSPRPRTTPRPTRRLPRPVVEAIVRIALDEPRMGERSIARALSQRRGIQVSHAAVGVVLRREGLGSRTDRASAATTNDRRVVSLVNRRSHGVVAGEDVRVVRLPDAAESQTDGELIHRAAAGDADAFGRLYRTYRAPILNLCRLRLKDHTLAEDVVQDTFIRALGSADRFERGRKALPWLLSIAKNRCIDLQRQSGRTAVMDPSDEFWLAVAGDDLPLNETLAGDGRRRVRRALARLSGRQRRALMLYAVEGWSYSDIARAEGTSLQAIKSLIFRARMNLRRWCADTLPSLIVLPARRLRALIARAGARGNALEQMAGVGADHLIAGLAALMLLLGGGGMAPVAASITGADVPTEESRIGGPSDSGLHGRVTGVTDPIVSGDLGTEGRSRVEALPDRLRTLTSPNQNVKNPEDMRVTAIGVSPTFSEDGTAYVAGDNNECLDLCPPVLFRTRDGGKTWHRLAATLLKGEMKASHGAPDDVEAKEDNFLIPETIEALLVPSGFGRAHNNVYAVDSNKRLWASATAGDSFVPTVATPPGNVAHGSIAVSPDYVADRRFLLGYAALMEYREAPHDLDHVSPPGVIVPAPYSVSFGPLKPAFSPNYTELGSQGRILVGAKLPVSLDQQPSRAEYHETSAVFSCDPVCTRASIPGWAGDAGGAPSIRFPADYPRAGVTYAFNLAAVARSADHGHSFTVTSHPWGSRGLQDVTVSPDGATVIAGVEQSLAVNGIWISRNRGDTWRHSQDDMVADGVMAVSFAGSALLAAPRYGGIACSMDGGSTWSARCS